MACPLLRTTRPCRCAAVAGEAVTPPKVIVSTLCRGGHQACPAYRYTRAAGKPLHRADFLAWVIHGISPGCVDGVPDPA